MIKKKIKNFIITAGLFAAFVILTVLITKVDVKPIGPENTYIGFASLNKAVRDSIGVNMTLYRITDWASIIALTLCLGFALLGLVQLIKRRSFIKVDSSILILGGVYILVFAFYVFFEFYRINYRPVLIDGYLEGSYPSSTTMLVLCIMPTAVMQFCRLIENGRIRNTVNAICVIYTLLMLVGRLCSGVHWFTDILGGILLSASLVMLYYSVTKFTENKKKTEQ